MSTAHARTSLRATYRARKSTRKKVVVELAPTLKILHAAAPQEAQAAGLKIAIPYLDQFFVGLGDIVVGGQDEVVVELVDTRRDDMSVDEAALVAEAIGGYAKLIGFDGRGEWRWHDGSRTSGVVSFVITG